MPKETDDARRSRKVRAGAWLAAERTRRGLTQVALAQALGLPSQNRISNYENGVYEIEAGIARDIARVFGLAEYDVWRGLEIPLPVEVEDPDKAVDWMATKLSGRQMVALAQKAAPELMAKSPRSKSKDPGNRPQDVTRTSERSRRERQGEQSAV